MWEDIKRIYGKTKFFIWDITHPVSLELPPENSVEWRAMQYRMASSIYDFTADFLKRAAPSSPGIWIEYDTERLSACKLILNGLTQELRNMGVEDPKSVPIDPRRYHAFQNLLDSQIIGWRKDVANELVERKGECANFDPAKTAHGIESIIYDGRIAPVPKVAIFQNR